jgi:fumarylpyruvate hydrolase
VQIAAREKGRPWDMGKAFDRSALIGQIVPVASWNAVADAAITLDVNGERKQRSKLSKLIWSVDEIIYWLSRYMDLASGDLIYTGTPEGVGPVVSGDTLEARIDGLPQLRISVT